MKELTIQSGWAPTVQANGQSAAAAAGQNGDFGKILKDSLETVDRLQRDADTAIEDMATGKQTDIHQTMIAMEKADVSFQLVMQVRNKLIAAYEEVMRMQV